MCEKFDNDRLRNDRFLGDGKSDKNKKNLFPGLNVHSIRTLIIILRVRLHAVLGSLRVRVSFSRAGVFTGSILPAFRSARAELVLAQLFHREHLLYLVLPYQLCRVLSTQQSTIIIMYYICKMQARDHCLNSILPEQKNPSLTLRPWGHQHQLTNCVYKLFKLLFLNHCLLSLYSLNYYL